MSDPVARWLSRQLTEMPPFLMSGFRELRRDLLGRVPVGDKAALLEHSWHIRECESDLYGLRIGQVLAAVGLARVGFGGIVGRWCRCWGWLSRRWRMIGIIVGGWRGCCGSFWGFDADCEWAWLVMLGSGGFVGKD